MIPLWHFRILGLSVTDASEWWYSRSIPREWWRNILRMELSEYNDWKLNYRPPDKGTSKDGSTRDAGETNSIYDTGFLVRLFCAVKGNPTCSFPRAAKPTEVSIGSHKKVIWRCEKGHEWEAAVKTLYFLPRSPPGIMMERLCALRRRQRGRSRGSRILLWCTGHNIEKIIWEKTAGREDFCPLS